MAKDQLVEIQVPDLSKVQAILGDLQHKAPSVLSRSINRTVTHVHKLMAKQASEHYIVKAGDVKKTLKIRKSSAKQLSGEALSQSDEKVKLIGFSVKPTKPDPLAAYHFRAHAKRSTKLKALDGSGDRSPAFVAKMSSGHVGIFQRNTTSTALKKSTDRTRRRASSIWAGRPDNPIKELYGPSVPSMFTDRKISDETIKSGREFYQRTLDHEIKYVLERYG